VTAERVREALGLVAEDELIAVLDVIADRRAADVFPLVARLTESGIDFALFLTGLADLLRAQLAIVLGGTAADLSEQAREKLEARRQRFAAADLLRMLQSIGELEPRFRKRGQQQLLIETLLVRFALLDRAVDLEDVLRSISAGGGAPPTGSGGTARRSMSAPPAAEPSAPIRRDAQATVRTEGSAVRAAPAPAVEPRPQARLERDTLELAKIVGRWDDLVERMRAGGKPMLASALLHASAVAVTADGVVAIELDEPNDIYAHAINTGRADVVATLAEWFDGITRADLRRQDAAPSAPPKRLTDEMVRAERIASLKRRDPVLSAAIDALDLDVAD